MENNNKEEVKKIEHKCCVCGEKVKWVSNPDKTLKALRCSTGRYDKILNKDIGCDFIAYAKQNLLSPRKLNKEDLLKINAGDTIRVGEKNVYIDPKNPNIFANSKTKKSVNYYVRVERDEDIEEEVI